MADAPKSFLLTPELHRYVVDHSTPVDPVAASLIAETAALGPISGMQVAPEQGALLGVLAAAMGARTVVEVGTFTGYSTLCLARGVGPAGRVHAHDVSDEWTAVGRRHWEEAGIADRIELRLGPAADTLATLETAAPVDLAFIDADKPGYATYLDLLHPRMRAGGLILVDNTLWSGRVLDPSATDDDTVALRAFNDAVATDDRFEAVLAPIADGLTFLLVR
ncbi:MAG: O-methyltransferase [Acidimicrobiales bacterium]